MLNIRSDIAKKQYHAILINQMKRLEATSAGRIRPILGQCYMSSARLLEIGVEDSVHVVENQMPRLRLILREHYLRTGTLFSDIIFKALSNEDNIKSVISYEIKGLEEDWWSSFRMWVGTMVAQQVTKVENTTKFLIKKIINKGVADGKSYKKIAKDLRTVKDIVNPYRASMIARTETHNSMTFSMQSAMDSSKVSYEKEWHSTIDERTRRGKFNHIIANGERVLKGEKFVRTGEPLERPGDPAGSAANIIQCRCILLYHVIKK